LAIFVRLSAPYDLVPFGMLAVGLGCIVAAARL